MMVTLDGINLFGEEEAEIRFGPAGRASSERQVAGLDGVLSVDIGGQGRKIKQAGELRGRSERELYNRIEAILDCLDGDTHTLVVGSLELKELRADTFKFGEVRISGSGCVCNYEIVYMQLWV